MLLYASAAAAVMEWHGCHMHVYSPVGVEERSTRRPVEEQSRRWRLILVGAALFGAVVMRSSGPSAPESLATTQVQYAQAHRAHAKSAQASVVGSSLSAAKQFTKPALSRVSAPIQSSASDEPEQSDPLEALRACLLDKKMTTYNVASVITKSRDYSRCFEDECNNADMEVETCKLSVQSFGECFSPFDNINEELLIGVEACTQRLGRLSVDKYIEKNAAAFSTEPS